ncbi:MAG: hypothetical protein N2110_05550 [Flavobacteriales bacterium]|nr:hypothetical protein [Flavobacteriales bacterium]
MFIALTAIKAPGVPIGLRALRCITVGVVLLFTHVAGLKPPSITQLSGISKGSWIT